MSHATAHDKRAMRVAVCDAAGGRCEYCGAYVGRRGTLDHYHPQALGGTNDRGNLRWACITCNALKADMPPEEWERCKPAPVPTKPTRTEVRVSLLQLIAQRMRGRLA